MGAAGSTPDAWAVGGRTAVWEPSHQQQVIRKQPTGHTWPQSFRGVPLIKSAILTRKKHNQSFLVNVLVHPESTTFERYKRPPDRGPKWLVTWKGETLPDSLAELWNLLCYFNLY